MSSGVVHIQWYATIGRSDLLTEAVAEWAGPTSLQYGATRFAVQRSTDDAYRILQQSWFESHDDWYRYWEGPEMKEFRARFMGLYQVPITYVWFDEYGFGDGAQAEAAPAEVKSGV